MSCLKYTTMYFNITHCNIECHPLGRLLKIGDPAKGPSLPTDAFVNWSFLFQMLFLPLSLNKTDWELNVSNHSNELCRNTQLQIGKVSHLQSHLKDCFDGRGLTFGSDVSCVKYTDMCLNVAHSNVDCPPLGRLLNSRHFCQNPSNFIDKLHCNFPRDEMSCTGNSPKYCFNPKLQCSVDLITHKQVGCLDASDYICPKSGFPDWASDNEEILLENDSYMHNFSRCESDGHFVCNDGKSCIHQALICDGYEQCEDGSDEAYEKCNACPWVQISLDITNGLHKQNFDFLNRDFTLNLNFLIRNSNFVTIFYTLNWYFTLNQDSLRWDFLYSRLRF